MSEYLEFFIKIEPHEGIAMKEIFIKSFCRSSFMYDVWNVPRGKSKKLSEHDFDTARARLRKIILKKEDMIEYLKERINVVGQFTNNLNDKYELCCDIESDIMGLTEEIEELKTNLTYVDFLEEISAEVNGYLTAGYEVEDEYI